MIINVVTSEVTYDEAKKMTIKDLKANIKERGLECKGCSEKDDYVKLFFDNQHIPKVEKSKDNKKTNTDSNPPNDDTKKKEFDEVSR